MTRLGAIGKVGARRLDLRLGERNPDDASGVHVTTPVPSLVEVDAICGQAEPVGRNLRITQAYHGLSAGVAARTGQQANWCTFATWASKQAGQTIRRQDLARTIEAGLGGVEEIGAAITRLSEILRAVGRVVDRSILVATLRDAASPVRAAERASEAVARGNVKVFEEIGRTFARFVAGLDEVGDAAARVGDGLRPGPPPDGQDLLRAAFAGYGRAIAAVGRRECAEQLLLANLRIGLHEQTRLQPEIARALDAPVAHPREVKVRLLARLFPDASPLVRRLGDDGGPLDEVVQRLVEGARRRVRRILTEHFMTLELPAGRLRLGVDVLGACPPHLLEPQDPELRELLATIDPVPDGPAGSGARDWADLAQRMHFIGELFRLRQDDASLLGAPFDAEQVRAIREGRMPDGRL